MGKMPEAQNFLIPPRIFLFMFVISDFGGFMRAVYWCNLILFLSQFNMCWAINRAPDKREYLRIIQR